MKNILILIATIACLASANNLHAQAKKMEDLGPFKKCGQCGVNCQSCTVCEDKQMTKNCKEWLCDDAGNCEQLPFPKSNANNIAGVATSGATGNSPTFQQPASQTNVNYVSPNALSTKTFNKGQLTANVIKRGALKEVLNVVKINKAKSLEIGYQKGQIVSMFAINNGTKSDDLIAEVKTVQLQQGSGGLNYTCGFAICQCDGEDDCIKMFGTNVCNGSAWCDTETGKCYCISFPQ